MNYAPYGKFKVLIKIKYRKYRKKSNKMQVYLDNAASTRVSKPVIELMNKAMYEDYANPSAKHLKGMEAEKCLKEAAAKIAKTMKVSEKELVFTSGGTESNNL